MLKIFGGQLLEVDFLDIENVFHHLNKSCISVPSNLPYFVNL